MSQPEKGMTPEQATAKKVSGHRNEKHFAQIIGGVVNPIDHNRKQDVHDLRSGWRYSVKAGKKWQIFLYARSRFGVNTTIKGIGGLSNAMIRCIDTLPPSREERERFPAHYKELLKTPMRELASLLQEENNLRAFFSMAAFDAGRVDFLSILPASINQVTAAIEEKVFHVFDAAEVVEHLCADMEVVNSQARGRGQTDAQKTVFRCPDSAGRMRNVGEIELRTDMHNYGRMKFWLQSARVLQILQANISRNGQVGGQIVLYGKAGKVARNKR